MKTYHQFIREQFSPKHMDHFVQYACGELGIENPPQIEVVHDPDDARNNLSFGGYYPADHKIKINVANRHMADILRTLGHELVHHKQNLNGELKDVAMAGETGSPQEDSANSLAGRFMRNYRNINPKIYE